MSLRSERKLDRLYAYFVLIILFATVTIILAPTPSSTGLHSLLPTFGRRLLGPCAICLYGLPRSFEASVLPSLIRNVIRTNLNYQCDYYVHFDNLEVEKHGGRDDRMGEKIDPKEILLLGDIVRNEYRKGGLPEPTISFCNTTPAQFYAKYNQLLHRIHTEKDKHGELKFLPYRHLSYTNGTVENVIKMWHSQQSVWNLMEQNPKGVHYARVALLRSDVVYLTELDIYETKTRKQLDYNNSVAVIPMFARYPVNDRMIYGPYDAARIWASERFSRMDSHAAHLRNLSMRGEGIHSERFLHWTLFPAIRQAGIELQEKEDLCFLRVRSDHSVRLSDCGKLHVTRNNHEAVEDLLQRKCVQNWTHSYKRLVQLDCPPTRAVDPFFSARNQTSWHEGCDPTLPRHLKRPPKHKRTRKILFWRPPEPPPPTRPPCTDNHKSLLIMEMAAKNQSNQTKVAHK
mmetsp:Transcript_16805/g.46165  ORF Transcript_16805/g.46165 Transcript_16805/m.46165 type:complete len:457 (+) Transcript_16805:16-1386(+)